MKRFTDITLAQSFSAIARAELEAEKANNNSKFDVEVGVNDYQVAPKNSSVGLSSEDASVHCISGYIDMGDYHSVFRYKKNLMSVVVDLVKGLDSDNVKEIKLFMPKKKDVLDFTQQQQRSYSYKMSLMENSLFAKAVDYEINHTPFVAPKVEVDAPKMADKIEFKNMSSANLTLVA